jgi:hypothetical protein
MMGCPEMTAPGSYNSETVFDRDRIKRLPAARRSEIQEIFVNLAIPRNRA